MSSDAVDESDVGKEIVPGVRLHALVGADDQQFGAMDWSPDGRTLAVLLGSGAKKPRIGLLSSSDGKLVPRPVRVGSRLSLAWSPSGRFLVGEGSSNNLSVLDAVTGDVRRVQLSGFGNTDRSLSFCWSSRREFLAVAFDLKLIIFSPRQDGKLQVFAHREFEDTGQPAFAEQTVAWSPDQSRLWCLTGGYLRLLEVRNDTISELSRVRADNSSRPGGLSWSPNGQVAVYCEDQSIGLLDAKGTIFKTLEGHTKRIYRTAFACSGDLLLSLADEGVIALRRTDTWDIVATVPGPEDKAYYNGWSRGLAAHPTEPIFASLDSVGRRICIWQVDVGKLYGRKRRDVHYTTARVALVGDSMVGKSHLGHRLAKDAWHPQPSTHGQQFWIVEKLGAKRTDGTECEAVLWDFAGQPDYRLVHAAFLDDIDVALLLFDPANPEDPLRGIDFWLRQLARNTGTPCKTILVATKLDRAAPNVTAVELQGFCDKNGISGGYVLTSALSGEGIDELMARTRMQIDWENRPATVTTRTFKQIKTHVLGLKEKSSTENILVTLPELRRRLEADDSVFRFGDAELLTAVEHLAKHGYVMVLHAPSGDPTVLLAPNVLVNLASSFVLEARRNPHGLGSLEEDRIASGGYSFSELNKLAPNEKLALLDAVNRLFLEKNICFREVSDRRTYLILPELINQKRPAAIDETEFQDEVTLVVRGAVAHVYSALVVLLGYTELFTRRNQWQNQAQYALAPEEICGFRQIHEREGEVELVLYYHRDTPTHVRKLFQGLFEKLLRRRPNIEIAIYPAIDCPDCGLRQPRDNVIRRIKNRQTFVRCDQCDVKIALGGTAQPSKLTDAREQELRRAERRAQLRTLYEASLVPVKRLADQQRGDRPSPSCFISYAWEEKRRKWVQDLAVLLKNAGVDVILDDWHGRPGTSLTEYLDRIDKAGFVLVVGTPGLLAKYQAKDQDHVIADELRRIGVRVRGAQPSRNTVLPLLVEGSKETAFPPMLADLVSVDLRDPERQLLEVFDLVLILHGLRHDEPALADLRQSLRQFVGESDGFRTT